MSLQMSWLQTLERVWKRLNNHPTSLKVTSVASPVDKTSSLAALTLDIAQRELGRGEQGGNNAGPAVAKYKGLPMNTKGDLGPWCSSFASWSFDQACLQAGKQPWDMLKTDEMTWRHKRHGAKAFYSLVCKAGTKISAPEVGALVCWTRGKLNSWEGHVGIVSSVQVYGNFTTTEGNRGGYPSIVSEFSHATGEGGLVGFARFP